METVLAQDARLEADRIHDTLRREIVPRLPELAGCRSMPELLRHPVYCALEGKIRLVLETTQAGSYADGRAPARDRYRILCWNIERGAQLEAQLHEFRTHPYLRGCDVLLLVETDAGMARSANRDVAREFARHLGMHYAFLPCYLSLVKGSGVEREAVGANELGLHGNAILSRYPIRRPRAVQLRNGIDKMACRERRIGSQKALVAEIDLPGLPLAVACVHLDANSSQRHRADQMSEVVAALPASGAALIGGDWNTTTFDSSSAFRAILGYGLRVLMGAGNVIRNHYLHPYRRFEKELFGRLEAAGFDYLRSNRAGEPTIRYTVNDERAFKNLAEWVPLWCFPFIRWALRNHGGGCPLKIDWFATRGLEAQNPVILDEFREGRAVPLSDHDAIGLEVGVAS